MFLKKWYLISPAAALVGLSLSVTYSSGAQAQILCSKNFLETVKIKDLGKSLGPKTLKFNSQKLHLRASVVSGLEKPTRDDFVQLEKVMEEVVRVKTVLNDQSAATGELRSLTQELQLEIATNRFFTDSHKVTKNSDQISKAYMPTEFEMKQFYQFYLTRLNKELPMELRIPQKQQSLNSRRSYINTTAKKTLKNLELEFENRFLTIGDSNFRSFETELRASKDPLVIKALQMIDTNQIEVILRRPETTRVLVPKVGLLNSDLKGNPKGDWPTRAEDKMYNLGDNKSYDAKDPDFKTKYGTVRAKSESGITSNLEWTDYLGSDIYTLKIDQIKDRLSIFPQATGWHGQQYSREQWNDLFIPWSHRVLMVPFMIKDLANNQMNAGQLSDRFQVGFNNISGNHWETQVLGSLTIRDVAEFEFRQNPPTGEFLTRLKKHKIKIRDGRTQPALDWTGD